MLNPAATTSQEEDAKGGWIDGLNEMFGGRSASARKGRSRETPIEAAAKSAARAIGSQVGREIMRGVLGTIFGGSKRR